MGSSMWLYWADYEPDFEMVLQKARRAVFDAGEYFLGPKPPLEWLGEPIDPDDPWDPDVPKDYLEYLTWLKNAGDRPATIEDLIRWNGPWGEGTQSIIDIERISDELFTVQSSTLVPDDLLLEIFGTVKPAAEMINDHGMELFELTSRGTAVHIVVYEDGQPDKIVYVGATFD